MRIEFSDITKTYGNVTALEAVSIDIPAGSTFGVLGTNGAGKTTLFELLVGHDHPDSGEITVGGQSVANGGSNVREHIGFLPERVGFPGLLTGREVLEIHGRIRSLNTARAPRIEAVLETVDLTDAADRQVAGYSNGMQTRLGLAAALLAEPPILVLDEPTAGLDPRGVETFHQLVEEISQTSDATIIISSHDLHEIERLCNAVAILHEGRLKAAGSVEVLTETAGGTTEITITVPDDDTAGRLVDIIRPFGTTIVGEEQVTLSCHPSEVVEVIEQLDTRYMEDIDIEKPGLDAAFHAAVEVGRS